MKIGILTFHSQLNYGGVLQCWALQTALEKMGHEVVVIDRWMDKNNWRLNRNYPNSFWKFSKKTIIRSIIGLGDSRFFKRVKRTRSFLTEKIHLSPYHFYEWSDAPRDLAVDIIVVGSDQVWNMSWPHSRFYLLEDVPQTLRRIAYAVSIGMSEIPEEYISIFIESLKKFEAISCRENEGCEICRKLGFEAMHVLDPTLLIDTSIWLNSFGIDSNNVDCVQKKLVCYFLSESVDVNLPLLVKFSQKNKCKIVIFVADRQRVQDLRQFPLIQGRMIDWFKDLYNFLFSDIIIYESAGPIEFIKEHASAKWILTDSFHSLMFSIIFDKNCRIIRPKNTDRKSMFSRIEEISKHTKGELISESVSEALESLIHDKQVIYDKEWLIKEKKKSTSFLEIHLR